MMNVKYALVAIALFIVEVIIATKLNNYHFIRAYFGDFLVVILLYCLLKAVYDFDPKRLAIGIFAFSVVVEVAQYFRIADVLQLTGWARVVVGTSFSFHDVLMYAAGCGVVYWVDSRGREVGDKCDR
ncbi:MAG: DUF2809 domain-containing protein [Thiothrix sp.]|uniref:ribosomal maturation YjgA family protein n=1 Tax=Thiothrix sp. TaxID=1032 RepID=UPI00262007BA|nr:DUF2809 domain-containing protein [Thiothrix sp.]MDD5391686.1 DUF2809 domain-containing protein [Thiothrix sp.]